MLPQSVVERLKSPYPSTQDPHYLPALQRQARELLAEPEDGVLDLIDRDWLERATRPHGNAGELDRYGLEWTLNIAAWMDLYEPRLVL